MYPINVVEKETNISKYLLRMWERRYVFPRPERDEKGERVYTNDDVEKLKLVKKLMEEGYRPSKIIDKTLPDLRDLSQSFADTPKDQFSDVIVVIAGADLHEDVRLALVNQHVKKTITISNQEDLKKLLAID